MERRTLVLHSVWGVCMLVAVNCASPGDSESPTAEAAAQSLEANVDGASVSWTACPEGFASECAWVPLPLDYAHPDGQTMPVFVSRRLASSGPSRAQLWLLQGGPGLSGNTFKGAVEQLLAPILPDVDFYVLEHRGVGESARLGCAEFESTSSQGGINITPDEGPACARALEARWGEGLAQFTITNDAHDLASLIERTREPDKKVFVYGLSYGTSRALRLLQAHPDAVDAVVLDSVVSPGVQFFSQFDLQNDRVAKDLSALCAADPVCGAKMGADPFCLGDRDRSEQQRLRHRQHSRRV